MKINTNYRNLEENYLFATIARKVAGYEQAHGGEAARWETPIIRLGIGDVTLPLGEAVVEAMQAAAGEMGRAESFYGYGPYEGYDFLREAVKSYYISRGVELAPEEIFISDGCKSDMANILDIAGTDNRVLIPDPVYPVYVDTNVMAGRKVLYMDANEGNGFLPLPEEGVEADIIYLCSPNNPTGAVYTRDMLAQWVEYANKRGAVILFDAAYEAFVREEGLPRSIFEIPGARTCAMEFCSLSKTAGFTGTRCGYTVIPRELEREGARLGELWLRRQSTKFNGVPYVVQRGAEAALSPRGLAGCRENIAYYLENAALMASTLREKGVWFTGGDNSPYLWMKCPGGMSSWEFFDYLLDRAHVVGTPGSGFGKNGEGFLRLTAFGSRENTREAMSRLSTLL